MAQAGEERLSSWLNIQRSALLVRSVQTRCLNGTRSVTLLKARDIFSLIQVYAEGVDLMEPIPLANGMGVYFHLNLDWMGVIQLWINLYF